METRYLPDKEMNKMMILGVAALIMVGAGAYMVSTANATGTLVVKITDPPLEWGPATNVYIRYRGISVHRASDADDAGWTSISEKDAWINLGKTLDINATVGNKAVKAGVYNQIRFEVLEAKVTVGGKNYTTAVESGALKIVIPKGGIEVKAGQSTGVLIDIVPKVIQQKDAYKIVPAAKAWPTKP